MIIYEVRLEFKKKVCVEFVEWLDAHINQMLALEGFSKAEIVEQNLESDPCVTVVHYRVISKDHLDDYLQNQAAVLRQEGLRKFPGEFVASRRIYYPE